MNPLLLPLSIVVLFVVASLWRIVSGAQFGMFRNEPLVTDAVVETYIPVPMAEIKDVNGTLTDASCSIGSLTLYANGLMTYGYEFAFIDGEAIDICVDGLQIRREAGFSRQLIFVEETGQQSAFVYAHSTWYRIASTKQKGRAYDVRMLFAYHCFPVAVFKTVSELFWQGVGIGCLLILALIAAYLAFYFACFLWWFIHQTL